VAHALKLTWMLTVPSAVGLAVVSVPTIRLIYERGAFGPADTAATAAVLVAYVVGLAPYSSVKMVVPAFYALDRPRVPMVASMTSVAVNISFNAATYRRLGAVGLATGTTLAMIVNIVILTLAFRRWVAPLQGQRLSAAGAKILAASSATGAAAWLSWSLLEGMLPVCGSGPFVTTGARLAVLVAPVAIGIGVYVLVCRILNLAEINEIIDPIRRRLRPWIRRPRP
jgi:putative peptidoglycan lipid II flippase